MGDEEVGEEVVGAGCGEGVVCRDPPSTLLGVVGLGDSTRGCCGEVFCCGEELCCCGEEVCCCGAGVCVGEGDTEGGLCTPRPISAGDLALGDGDGVHILDDGDDLLLLDNVGDPCLGVGG